MPEVPDDIPPSSLQKKGGSAQTVSNARAVASPASVQATAKPSVQPSASATRHPQPSAPVVDLRNRRLASSADMDTDDELDYDEDSRSATPQLPAGSMPSNEPLTSGTLLSPPSSPAKQATEIAGPTVSSSSPPPTGKIDQDRSSVDSQGGIMDVQAVYQRIAVIVNEIKAIESTGLSSAKQIGRLQSLEHQLRSAAKAYVDLKPVCTNPGLTYLDFTHASMTQKFAFHRQAAATLKCCNLARDVKQPDGRLRPECVTFDDSYDPKPPVLWPLTTSPGDVYDTIINRQWIKPAQQIINDTARLIKFVPQSDTRRLADDAAAGAPETAKFITWLVSYVTALIYKREAGIEFDVNSDYPPMRQPPPPQTCVGRGIQLPYHLAAPSIIPTYWSNQQFFPAADYSHFADATVMNARLFNSSVPATITSQTEAAFQVQTANVTVTEDTLSPQSADYSMQPTVAIPQLSAAEISSAIAGTSRPIVATLSADDRLQLRREKDRLAKRAKRQQALTNAVTVDRQIVAAASSTAVHQIKPDVRKQKKNRPTKSRVVEDSSASEEEEERISENEKQKNKKTAKNENKKTTMAVDTEYSQTFDDISNSETQDIVLQSAQFALVTPITVDDPVLGCINLSVSQTDLFSNNELSFEC
jgi:hypothetical protein